MLPGVGLFLIIVVVALLIGVIWRFDGLIDAEEADDDGLDADTDRIVTQVAAAQRLRREAETTTDPQERETLLRLANEADGTVEKIRRGLISDQ